MKEGKMQKWEYKKIWREMDLTGVHPFELGPGGPSYIWKDILDDKDTTRFADEMRRLRRLGDEGWELVSVLYSESSRISTYTYYLKRGIPNPPIVTDPAEEEYY